MFKRFALILAAVVAGMLGAVAVSAPVQAAPTCPETYFCFFDQNNWQGTKYVVDPYITWPNTCFNMGTDPTGFDWHDKVDSVWWSVQNPHPDAYVEFYEGWNCTIRAVTRANAYGPNYDQMQSCLEAAPWDGPCGPPNNVAKRISSWAFSWS